VEVRRTLSIDGKVLPSTMGILTSTLAVDAQEDVGKVWIVASKDNKEMHVV